MKRKLKSRGGCFKSLAKARPSKLKIEGEAVELIAEWQTVEVLIFWACDEGTVMADCREFWLCAQLEGARNTLLAIQTAEDILGELCLLHRT